MSKRQRKLSGETPEITMHGITVKRSYSRKLNMSAHGGLQYETADFVEERSCSVLDQNEANVASELLFKQCFESVERTIKEFDALMLGEAETKPRKKKEPLDEIGMSEEEVSQIAPIINKLVAANSEEELQAVGNEIEEIKGDLNENQLSFLRLKYNAKGKVLKR